MADSILARERAAAHLINQGKTSMRVFDHLQRAKPGTVKEIAAATGLTPGAVWNALSRLRGIGVARVVTKEATPETSGCHAAIWWLESAYADFKASEPIEEPAPIRTIVQRALAAQPPLATVWMEAM